METIIRTEKLTKCFKNVEAVSQINLSVNKGEIYGFLGLNGAGKTTTIRMLLGMVNPTSGKAFIHHKLIGKGNCSLWEKTGYLVEVPHAYPMLTVEENLHIIRKLRRISDKTCVDRMMERLELSQYARRKFKHLSLGNKQRVGLAKALMHKPEILLLDEPTNGLDPAGIHDIRELLSNLAREYGVTILISSHILGEISQFASRIGIIHKGKMIQEINSAELDKLCEKQLLIQTSDNKKACDLLDGTGLKNCMINNGQIIIKDKEAINKPEVIAELIIDNNLKLCKLNIEEENLESYFLRTIKGE